MSKKIKIVKTGWIGRTVTRHSRILRNNAGSCLVLYVSGIKGRRRNWYHQHWPPRKVRITVEEL